MNRGLAGPPDQVWTLRGTEKSPGPSKIPQLLSSPALCHYTNYISGTKAFNHLPQYLKLLVSDVKRFKISLKRFLYHHSFYSVKEYYEHNEDKDM